MHKKSTASRTVTGVGAAVTGLGALMGGPIGAGIIGFGLANVALGLLSGADTGMRSKKH